MQERAGALVLILDIYKITKTKFFNARELDEMMHRRGFVSLRMYLIHGSFPPPNSRDERLGIWDRGTSSTGWISVSRFYRDLRERRFGLVPGPEKDESMECVVNGACNRDCHTVTMR